MKSLSSSLVKSLAVRSAVAIAAVAACSGASAVTSFTFTPTTGGVVTADTLTVNDYALVTPTSPTSFSEQGYLAVSNFNLGGTIASAPGLNSTYGLYIAFTSTGSLGLLNSLNFQVYEYAGSAGMFTASDSGVTKSVTGTMIASGGLIPGPSDFYSTQSAAFGASLTANTLTFSNTAGAFSPIASAVGSFINSANQLTPTAAGGFYVNGAGGGTINLIPAVPEPETYALMLGGLAAVGFIARRRSNT